VFVIFVLTRQGQVSIYLLSKTCLNMSKLVKICHNMSKLCQQ